VVVVSGGLVSPDGEEQAVRRTRAIAGANVFMGGSFAGWLMMRGMDSAGAMTIALRCGDDIHGDDAIVAFCVAIRQLGGSTG
jgi:hypothetical protein